MTQIEEENFSKYLHPPSIKQITEFIDEIGVSDRHFERFYGMPLTSISHVRAGTRTLQVKFWHFIYEKIKPAYGSGFLHSLRKSKNKMLLTKTLTSEVPEMDNHGRLGRLKTK